MSSWFGPKAPSRVPTDTVAPLRFWDDAVLLKSLVVYFLARYDSLLDAEKLRSSLERLASIKGWKKLGARLRKNSKGEIEYHVPETFTAERPAIAFSHAKHDVAINAHPLASQLPRPNPTRPIIAGDPEIFTPLLKPEGAPTKIDDYLVQDRGQLGLHVVSFLDATLVILYYNHTSFDLMGWGALMTAWTHVLHGREDQVATPVGGDPGSDDFDSLSSLGTNPTEPHVLQKHLMQTAGLVGYGASNIIDLAFRGKENRIVCVPGAFIENLRTKILAELQAEATASGSSEKPFVTEADVLGAWWTKLAVTSLMKADSSRTVNLQYAASARKALGMSTDPAKNPYFSNLFTMLYTLLPASEIIQKPVSHLAREIRRSVVEQGTREQVEAYFALQRQAAGKMVPFFGDAGMHLMTLSNWGKADLYGHDFSPAAVSEDDAEKSQYPSYIQTTQLPFNFPEGFCVIGQDNAKNFWLYGFRIAGYWDKVEQALRETDGL